MAAISTWSKTAASNNAAPPDGWPENQRPSTVNDCAREMMAAIRTQWEGTEWFDFGYTPTRTGATTFTMAGDYTSVFVAKRPIRCNDSATLYGKVVSAVFGSPNTTVTVSLDSGSLTASLSAVALHALMPVASGGVVVDEDDMTSNADFKVPTQQSVKAYVGNYVSANAVASSLYLSANRNYYVNASTGNDSNTGLSSGAAFLTIQKACDVVSGLFLNGNTVTINVADGAYNAVVTLKPPMGYGRVIVLGNTATPANVTISSTSCFALFDSSTSSGWSGAGTTFIVRGFTLSGSAGNCFQHNNTSVVLEIGNIVFGTCSSAHVVSSPGKIIIRDNCEITGNSTRWLEANRKGFIRILSGKTITLTGTPAFSSSTVFAENLSFMEIPASTTFSGSATGTRYSVTKNAVIDTGGGGATFIPGSVAGSTATGGQYI